MNTEPTFTTSIPDYTPTFTAEDVTSEIIRLATEHPDAVYRAPDALNEYTGTCTYTTGTAAGKSGCLFGQAFANLGVPHDVMLSWDDNNLPIDDVADKLFTDAPVEWVWVQCAQDSGRPWGHAIKCLEDS